MQTREFGAQWEADDTPKRSNAGEFNESTIYEGAGGFGVHGCRVGEGKPRPECWRTAAWSRRTEEAAWRE